jgi:hypothetical protein
VWKKDAKEELHARDEYRHYDDIRKNGTTRGLSHQAIMISRQSIT